MSFVKTSLFICFVLILTGSVFAMSAKPGPCDNKQWKEPGERLKCLYPDPPHGRWHAVYSNEFAKKYDLPDENISSDLSPGVDYMEMDVQPYGSNGTACLVNMLMKKPHDVRLYNTQKQDYPWAKELHERRELAHLIELDNIHKSELKQTTAFGLVPRKNKYDPRKSYSIGSSFAFYAEDVLQGYDYFTVNAGCYPILSTPDRFPNGWGFNYAKASFWGRYKPRFKSVNDPEYPDKREFFDSRLAINIPSELISNVFNDMPIGGRHDR